MRILVLADTHLTAARAPRLIEILEGRLVDADAIIHAGDITAPEVLDILRRYAPVYAVVGNNDDGIDLPEVMTETIADVEVAVIHDSGSALGRSARLGGMFPDADVVVFGHSHLPWYEQIDIDGRNQHHFNPGSPTQRRRAPTRTIGWIETDAAEGITCRHEDVE